MLISLLPTLGKALKTTIILNAGMETDLDAHVEQHWFTTDKSMVGALKSVYR